MSRNICSPKSKKCENEIINSKYFSYNKEEGDEEVRETPRTPTIQRRMTPRIIPRRKMSFPAVSISAPQLKQQASQKMFLNRISLRARLGRAHMPILACRNFFREGNQEQCPPCCIFWPAFGCILIFSVFCAKKLKKR